MIPSLLRHFLRLERLQGSPDGRGGWIEDWSLVAESPGRLQPLTGRSLELAGRLHAEARFALYLPPDLEARRGDRVRLGSRRFQVLVTGLGHPGRYEKLLLRELS